MAHDGAAQDALVPTLNLTAQYVSFYIPGYTDIQVYANLAKPFKLALLSLSRASATTASRVPRHQPAITPP